MVSSGHCFGSHGVGRASAKQIVCLTIFVLFLFPMFVTSESIEYKIPVKDRATRQVVGASDPVPVINPLAAANTFFCPQYSCRYIRDAELFDSLNYGFDNTCDDDSDCYEHSALMSCGDPRSASFYRANTRFECTSFSGEVLKYCTLKCTAFSSNGCVNQQGFSESEIGMGVDFTCFSGIYPNTTLSNECPCIQYDLCNRHPECPSDLIDFTPVQEASPENLVQTLVNVITQTFSNG